MRVFKGHDPTHGEDGTDLLLTEHDDGTFELATRPGFNRTQLRWGPPTVVEEVPR
jgi:hypothetical protein